jgi:integrase
MVKLPNGKWMTSNTWDRLVDAEKEERELIAIKEKTWRYDIFAPLPFDETSDEWYVFQEMRGASASHLERIKMDFDIHHKPYYGSMNIKEIRPSDIQKYVNELKKKLAPFTLNRTVITLKSFFNWLIEEDRLERNPIKKKHLVPWVRTNQHPVWTREEAEHFLEYADGKYALENRWVYFFYKILLTTGMRFGEATALEKADIDFENSRIRINKAFCNYSKKLKLPKNNTARFATLSPKLAEELQEYFVKNAVFGPLFTNKDGEYYSYDKIRGGHYLRDVKAAGVRYCNLHNLRRFFITQYVENGGHEAQLRKMVGHASQTMTDWYLSMPENFEKISSIVNL